MFTSEAIPNWHHVDVATTSDVTGTAGTPTMLLSNFFQLKQGPGFHLYQYHVSFSPEIENKIMRQRLVKEHRDMLGKARAFDGMLLFLAHKLEQPVRMRLVLGRSRSLTS